MPSNSSLIQTVKKNLGKALGNIISSAEVETFAKCHSYKWSFPPQPMRPEQCLALINKSQKNFQQVSTGNTCPWCRTFHLERGESDFGRFASYFLKTFLEVRHLYFLGFISSSWKMGELWLLPICLPRALQSVCRKPIYPLSCAVNDRPVGLSGPIMCSWFLLHQRREYLIIL